MADRPDLAAEVKRLRGEVEMLHALLADAEHLRKEREDYIAGQRCLIEQLSKSLHQEHSTTFAACSKSRV